MRFVLDCSATIPWFFHEEETPLTKAIRNMLGDVADALVPIIWQLEVTNVLLISERRGRITPEKTAFFLSQLKRLPIHTDFNLPDFPMQNILLLARKHTLTSYDAMYLELAIREGIPMATLDKDLQKAAKKENIICLDESHLKIPNEI